MTCGDWTRQGRICQQLFCLLLFSPPPPSALPYKQTITVNNVISCLSSKANMSDSDTALLPWESVNDAFFGSHYDSTAPQITSLLSACSYPVPQQIRQQQRRQQDVQLPLLGGIIPENQLLLYNNDTQPTQPPVKSLKRTRNEVEKSGSSALTKRGRPRKVAQDTADEDPEEVRETQLVCTLPSRN